MVQVISNRNSQHHDALMREMFAERKRVFVDKYKWDVPVLDGRYEIDQFDTPQAIYLIVTDAARHHLGSMRLLPTSKPHVLGDIFPQLCEEGVPTGDDIWEISRLCTSPDLDRAQTMKVRGQLFLAMIEVAVLYGVTAFTGVAHMQWLSQILHSGMDVKPLGAPQTIGDEMVGALHIKVSPATLAGFRKATGRAAPTLEIESAYGRQDA